MRHTLKILLADDEEEILGTYIELLEANKHTVTAASNGREVLELLNTKAFDMLILDLYMPEMNGFEAIYRLRKEGNTVPIIVITGHFPEDVVMAKLKYLKVSAALRKPVMITTLLNAVNEAVSDNQ